jgi:nucleotide-binding universal stress UspA family protein
MVQDGVAVANPRGVSGAELQGAAEKLLTKVGEAIDGVKIQNHAVVGSPADVVIGVAEEVGADLIVVGSKGMRGARRVIGSVPNSIAHGGPCHVLIAKTA